MGKVDRRIIRTNQRLATTYLELLRHKEFAAITVKELCDQADVDKATFYKHYQDKYDFTEALVLQELANYRQVLIQRFTVKETNLDQLRVIMDHLQILRQIDNHTLRIDQELQQATAKVYSKFLFPTLGGQLKDYDRSMQVFAAMMIELIRLYGVGDFSPSQKQMDHQLNDLVNLLQYLQSR